MFDPIVEKAVKKIMSRKRESYSGCSAAYLLVKLKYAIGIDLVIYLKAVLQLAGYLEGKEGCKKSFVRRKLTKIGARPDLCLVDLSNFAVR